MGKRLKLVGNCIIATSVAVSIIAAPYFLFNKELKFTEAQSTYQREFYEELQTIKDDYDIEFSNNELYCLVKNQIDGEVTVDKIHNIKSLTIPFPISSSDFSDLKYLINLEKLSIRSNCVDCSDLTYNQNLTELTLDECTV